MPSINFFSETQFTLENPEKIISWMEAVIAKEGCSFSEITYVFCDDSYLHSLNVEYLKHDTLTDIISFDYSEGKELQGEIYISVERVSENAITYGVSFENELLRVLIHGILHFAGYKDKTKKDEQIMRLKEEESIALYYNVKT